MKLCGGKSCSAHPVSDMSTLVWGNISDYCASFMEFYLFTLQSYLHSFRWISEEAHKKGQTEGFWVTSKTREEQSCWFINYNR